MDSETLKPILAGIVRHALTALGGALVTDGFMQSSQLTDFIGAGMLIAGIVWSWWQKRGQKEVADLLKKATGKNDLTNAKDAAKGIIK